ncbi:hypothetical protein CBL_06673 [Carabus blaptoides fortunei]
MPTTDSVPVYGCRRRLYKRKGAMSTRGARHITKLVLETRRGTTATPSCWTGWDESVSRSRCRELRLCLAIWSGGVVNLSTGFTDSPRLKYEQETTVASKLDMVSGSATEIMLEASAECPPTPRKCSPRRLQVY